MPVPPARSFRIVAGLFWEILYVMVIAVLVGLYHEFLVVSSAGLGGLTTACLPAAGMVHLGSCSS